MGSITMHKYFQNKVFLVTGASSGIGFATAQLINRQGGAVCALARNRNNLQSLLDLSLNRDISC